ncbi:MAG: MFS transporter [Gammaproteobacteria bacterium]|nr:MFS transporter [Gammaproteobacteria bacterium]
MSRAPRTEHAAADSAPPPLPWPARSRLLRSLAHANFRRYYIGQLVSLNGTWMQQVAQSWLLYRLTESSLMLGLAGAATLAPSLVLGLYGGVLADKLSRRRLMIAAQALAMVQALVLGILTLGGWVVPWHVLALALLLGMVQAFELPARHSLVAALVPREALSNAVALNSSSFHLARFIGPAIAGALVAWAGEGPVFLLNALTFVAVLGALTSLRLPAPAGDGAGPHPRGLGAGLRYAWDHAQIRAALVMVAMASVFGASTIVLMPVFAVEVFGRGPQSLGALMGALGAGALVGALTLARRGGVIGLERVIAVAALIGGLALGAFALTDRLWLGLVILPLVGFNVTTLMASSNAFIQLTVPDALRGRVMALFSVALHGCMPIGHLAVGGAAEWLGAPRTVATCALVLAAAGLVFRARVRPSDPPPQSQPRSANDTGSPSPTTK